jgi:DNA polymerase-1
MPPLADTDDRIHASWSQAGTTTGRMSSNNPNLQNIPIKNELGKRIREGFIAEKGRKLLALDYSQIELRIAAFLSGDKTLIDIFKNGSDVHAAVASRVFKVPESEVTSEMRRKAKVINFGILYGMGVNALRANLKTDRAEAQAFYNQYFETFSGLSSYIDRVRKQAGRDGYTETFFGRRRRFEGINSPIPFVRAAAERMAVNAPFQGTQADIIKMAMRRADDYLTKEKLQEKVFLVLQVHDELIYEVDEKLVESVGAKIKSIMEGVLSQKETDGVPIVANVRSGLNWGQL